MRTMNFNPKTDKMLNCPCGCGAVVDNIGVYLILEDIREHFGGSPVTITSGARCREYNRSISGAVHSRHIFNDAVDFTVKDVEPEDVFKYVDGMPYADSLGLAHGSNFVHLDTRGKRARWTY